MTFRVECCPEAWIQDVAYRVDPPGPTTWFTEELPAGLREAVIEANGVDVVDSNDLLQNHPAAPEWVREWSGPFTIYVRVHHG